MLSSTACLLHAHVYTSWNRFVHSPDKDKGQTCYPASVYTSTTHVPLVHNLEVSPLQEAAHLGLPGQNGLDQVSGDLLPLLVRQRHVPLLQAQLSLPAEQQHELHLEQGGTVRRVSASYPHHGED